MENKLAVIYAVLFLLNVCLFILSVIKSRKSLWTTLFICEAVCLAIAVGSIFYFNAPGFTNILEVSYSLFAAIAFVLIFGVSVITRDIHCRRVKA